MELCITIVRKPSSDSCLSIQSSYLKGLDDIGDNPTTSDTLSYASECLIWDSVLDSEPNIEQNERGWDAYPTDTNVQPSNNIHPDQGANIDNKEQTTETIPNLFQCIPDVSLSRNGSQENMFEQTELTSPGHKKLQTTREFNDCHNQLRCSGHSIKQALLEKENKTLINVPEVNNGEVAGPRPPVPCRKRLQKAVSRFFRRFKRN